MSGYCVALKSNASLTKHAHMSKCVQLSMIFTGFPLPGHFAWAPDFKSSPCHDNGLEVLCKKPSEIQAGHSLARLCTSALPASRSSFQSQHSPARPVLVMRAFWVGKGQTCQHDQHFCVKAGQSKDSSSGFKYLSYSLLGFIFQYTYHGYRMDIVGHKMS